MNKNTTKVCYLIVTLVARLKTVEANVNCTLTLSMFCMSLMFSLQCFKLVIFYSLHVAQYHVSTIIVLYLQAHYSIV